MANVIVVTATNGCEELTFTVVDGQDELLYGRVKWHIYEETKLSIKAECYERNGHSELHGFTEKFYTDPTKYIWKIERIQDECMQAAIKKAMPDANILKIINI